jgi:DNA-binding IclR family transcriptional regulator
MRRVDEVSVASEYLGRLRDRTGYAVELCSWSDGGAIMIRWQDGSVPLPVRIRVGSVVPMLESAAGRVFLAFLPRAVTAPVVRAQLAASISEPLSDEALERMLAEVRASGVAVARGVFVRGTIALAAPIFNGEGRLVLVMAMLAPSVRVPDSALPKLTAALREAAEGVSRELGYVPKPAG